MKKKEAATIINISSIKAVCRDCTLREFCLPSGLSGLDMEVLDRLAKRFRLLRKGELLYRFGDPLRSIYAVRKGTLKTTGLMEDGRAQVTGFYLAGEILGVDAINADHHPCSAEALESSEVCEIPYAPLEDLARQALGLQHRLLRIMSREIVRDEQLLMMLGRMTAEEKLAWCLLSFSRRQARLGMPETDIRLSMSRQDLGDYLGLALETVSRLFSRLQEDGVLSVRGRQIHLHSLNRLQAMANSSPGSESLQA